MIRVSESLLLARTKLKTRKIRLVITVVVTSLLFGVLVSIASVTDGTLRSLQEFNKEGYGGKFLVQAMPQAVSFGQTVEKDMIQTLQPVQDDIIARKKVSAKKLGIIYDPANDQSLPMITTSIGPSQSQTFLNYQSPIVIEELNARSRAIPGTRYEDFIALARAAGATTTYRGTNQGGGYAIDQSQAVSVVIDGKEKVQQSMQDMQGPPDTTGVASIMSLGWRNADPGLLQPFVLPGESLVTGADASVPVIAPFSAAEEILGLKALPSTASSDQKIARLVDVRSRIAGTTAQLCYRNGASSDLFRQASEQIKEIATNKGKKDYVPPALLYKLPTDACGAVVIQSDKRNAEEKKEAANKTAFDTEFGQVSEPVQGVLTIRIIGLNADVDYEAALSPTAVLTGLLSSSIGAGWISPAPAVEVNPLARTIQGGSVESAAPGRVDYFAEFANLTAMENFIKDQACEDLDLVQGPNGEVFPSGISDPEAAISQCITQGKVYTVIPYGNSAGAVEQFRAGVWKFARFAILGIVIIASLILMGNLGKIIADSRRETAVFRSLGAKRFDIIQIYLTYTVLISLLIAACAIAVGSVAAIALNSRLTDELSVAAVLAYNAQDVTKVFSLFGFNPLYIAAIVGLIIITGLLSATLPLLSNMRRNPIRDMRDDA